jgi:hypothetical protein
MITDNTINFELSSPIKVSLDGDFLESSVLILKSPRMIDFNLVSKMVPIVTENFLKFSKTLSKDKNENIEQEQESDLKDGELEKAIEMSLYSCEKLSELSQLFNKLVLKKDICLFDGEVQMKDGYLSMLDYNDYITLLCKYCGAFIFPKQMLKNMN